MNFIGAQSTWECINQKQKWEEQAKAWWKRFPFLVSSHNSCYFFPMPGAKCSILNCSASRLHKGIWIFKVRGGDDEFSTKWREKLINIVIRDRVVDCEAVAVNLTNQAIPFSKGLPLIITSTPENKESKCLSLYCGLL